MTDVEVAGGSPDSPKVKFIPHIDLKAGAGGFDVDLDTLPDASYQAIIIAGLEAILAKANGAAKILAGITKLEGAELEKRKAEVLDAATKTIQQLQDGIVPGAKKAKTSGAEATEAMRLAKNMVKDLIRNSGQKIGAYSAKEITEAAKQVLARNPHLLELARKNLAERAQEAKGSKALDLAGLFGAKASSEEVKAKPKVAAKPRVKGEKAPISARQAGLAAPRQKPGTHVTH
jgi:hypothetical protein